MKIAGSAQERSDLMPLLYVDDTPSTKSSIEQDMTNVLNSFHKSGQGKPASILKPSNRMKPLDVVKVLMGILSSRECISRFKYDGVFWGKLLEYDYEQLMIVADQTVNSYYLQKLAQIQADKDEKNAKRRKLNE